MDVLDEMVGDLEEVDPVAFVLEELAVMERQDQIHGQTDHVVLGTQSVERSAGRNPARKFTHTNILCIILSALT